MRDFEWLTSRVKRALLPAPPLEWRAGYTSWADALSHSAGYDERDTLTAAIAATRDVVEGRAAYERDGVTFSEIQYSWPLLASLLYIASEADSLRVVDVGGALGSTYRQNRSMLVAVPEIRWMVVEQPAVARAGAAEFASDELSFTSDMANALEAGADLALFGSSLCYLPDPAAYLRDVTDSGIRFLALDRTPFIAEVDHEITVQHVRMHGRETSYPCWRFATKRFEDEVSVEWRQVLRWECDLQPDPAAINRGYLFERRT
ncbi:MAG: methyltransferase, TIGR04325 family [Coriobacteriia bacterium]|jgi:putative methyltransferase (TIGR04325 family)|nr:methyltransferase, TIGR04325 family [Coriobacteriia bacterium]